MKKKTVTKKESYRPSASLIKTIKETEKEFAEGKLVSYKDLKSLMKALKS